jgi:hypothetical protein
MTVTRCHVKHPAKLNIDNQLHIPSFGFPTIVPTALRGTSETIKLYIESDTCLPVDVICGSLLSLDSDAGAIASTTVNDPSGT